MLKIYSEEILPLIISDKDWYIEHKYDGSDVLKFEIPDTHASYKYIAEEVRITDGSNRYVIKKIDEHGGYVNVECDIDLDDWRKQFWKEFRTINSTLLQVIEKIRPEGWNIQGADKIKKRATIESSEGKGLENVVALDVLKKASEVYEVVFNFNVISKMLIVINPSEYEASGDYLTDELNLKSVGFTGNSSEFVTRLYAYGKKDSNGNPVTFSAVNGGKEYIDNNQYSDRIISAGWTDERYNSPQSLLEAARKKLDGLSYPVRSYECDVRNFDENMYMYKVVTLIDRKRKKRTEHRVVAFKEYPEAHYYDVLTLSAVPPKIEASMRAIKAEISEKAFEAQRASTDAVLDAMKVITGQNGVHVRIVLKEGVPEEIRIEHSDGTCTVAEAAGLSRGTGGGYFFLAESGRVELTAENGFKKSVQLPDSFTGRDVHISLNCAAVMNAGSAKMLQSISNSWTYDKGSTVLSVESNCRMYDIEAGKQTEPDAVILEYIVMGR